MAIQPIERPEGEGRTSVPLELVHRLCAELNGEAVVYCHWKSNDVLERALRAESDLDLLVRRDDAARFEEVIGRLGFRIVQAPPMRRVPDVFHAYALDAATGKLVHLHVHYELILGDDTTKNYRLPVEEPYLTSALQGPWLPVPAPDVEFVVFVLRMILKHSTWDAIASGKGRLSASEVREMVYLTERTDLELGGQFLHEHLPAIDRELFERCLWCLRPGTSRRFRMRTAHRVELALAPHARRRPGSDAAVRLWRRTRIVARRHLAHRTAPRGRLPEGGAVIAVVGGDGAGKSTVVTELSRWLSDHLTTSAVHFGKPRRSMTSAIVHGLRKSTPPGVVRSPSVSGESLAASDGTSMTFRALLRLFRQVLVARDRYLTDGHARRFAAGGGIVIADRYPLPEIELMDGPLASKMVAGSGSRIVRSLARREQRYYDRIGDPDILIVLRVPPGVAAERKQGIDDEDVVRRRCEEVWRADWHRLPAVAVIDAGRSEGDVLAEVKSAIWSRL